MAKKIPEDVQLIHGGGEWKLSFGTYHLTMPACECELIPCTCCRRLVKGWTRAGSHERTHCHRGHAEHMAIILRRAVRGGRS